MRSLFTRIARVCCIIPVLMLITCSSETNDLPPKEAIVVKTEPVRQQDVSISIHTSGKLASKSEIKLSFKIGGIISQLTVDEGQRVHKNQLLAKLNQSEIQAQVVQARSGYDKAKRDLERVNRLFADSVATMEQVQDASTGLNIAKSNLEIAEFNLKHSAIHAPANGNILKRFAESNELIAAGHPVFLLGSGGTEWIVRAGVSDREALNLQLNDSASVVFDAYPNHSFAATVTEIAEAADPYTGTFEIELKINSRQIKLISGFIGRITISPSKKRRSVMIPIEAFIEGTGNQGIVYVPDAGGTIARRLPVVVGDIHHNKIEVLSGLESAARVITEGAPYLSDGCKIEMQ
ncbi:efflux RND transporter periplasmic adaptor subunit [candidate division KSB1 bacterium]|nr:efflux RND transporter periplasmic adaptor subunit [candidate division KSB1 bacterium]